MPEVKKSKWLQEVEDDAIRIQTKRFRDQEEERQYKIAKAEAEKPKAEAPKEVEEPAEVSATPEVKPVQTGKKGK